MDNYCIAIFKSNELQEEESCIKKFFRQKLWLFRREDKSHWFETLELSDDLSINLIRIPYSMEKYKELKDKSKARILKDVKQICFEKGAKYCILPYKTQEDNEDEGFYKNCNNGKILFKALLVNIINKICSMRNLDINSIEITIINGDDNTELLQIVKLLSSFTKFITIITKDMCIKNEVEEIFYETGTSICISEDFSNIKRADIIINLGDAENFKYFITKKTVVLNYGKATDFNKKTWVINDIRVSLPLNIISKVDNSLWELYNVNEISEMLVLHKAGYSAIGDGVKNDPDYISKLADVFDKDGYKLDGLE